MRSANRSDSFFKMAPVREKSATPGPAIPNEKDEEKQQNIWSTIIREVQTSSKNKLPSTKSLLVLGDNESGKTTLIAKLKGTGDPKKGAGMEYFFLDVRDEYREDHTRLGVYILDGEPEHAHLLKFALSTKNFENVTVMFCVSMTTPWCLMDSLTTWASILQNHADTLEITPEQRKEFKRRVIKRWQDYMEPGDEMEAAASQMRRTTNVSVGSATEDDISATSAAAVNSSLPLPENVLTVNLGLDIVVVVTKTDFMANLEKEHDYKDEHFDFIQQSIRRFCLHYGASLFYTSVKEDKNCDLLYKHLVHRIYAFPFHTPALVVEKDAVFIPSGWDNEKKIAILHENMTTMKPDDFFSDVIVKPVVRRPIQRDIEIQAEDEQLFLARQQSLLNQQLPTPSTGSPRQVAEESPIRTASGVQKTPDRRLSGSPGVQQASIGTPKKMDSAKGGPGTSEGVLANFFNSLLSKKSGSPGSHMAPASGKVQGEPGGGLSAMSTPTAAINSGSATASLRPNSANSSLASPALEKSSVRSDAAAELDRMTRSKKPSLSPAPSSAANNLTPSTSSSSTQENPPV